MDSHLYTKNASKTASMAVPNKNPKFVQDPKTGIIRAKRRYNRQPKSTQDSGPPPGLTGAALTAWKKKRKLQKNREAAHLFRMRQINYVSDLKTKIQTLSNEIIEDKVRVAQLQTQHQEMIKMRDELLNMINEMPSETKESTLKSLAELKKKKKKMKDSQLQKRSSSSPISSNSSNTNTSNTTTTTTTTTTPTSTSTSSTPSSNSNIVIPKPITPTIIQPQQQYHTPLYPIPPQSAQKHPLQLYHPVTAQPQPHPQSQSEYLSGPALGTIATHLFSPYLLTSYPNLLLDDRFIDVKQEPANATQKDLIVENGSLEPELQEDGYAVQIQALQPTYLNGVQNFMNNLSYQ